MSALAAISGGPKNGNQGKVHRSTSRGSFAIRKGETAAVETLERFFLLRLRIKSNTHTNISTEGEGIL
ncbi:hypothetical protein L2E82_11508 [Cichorium intybus]|uniref:Uncharacterized protein n=1 Tax=Cichorium intybus TaxID=13427 RepID=A0ACB9GDC9_CICIN|nr:hypothetical protein L2E82_11508 [Cichorium intybus]